MDSTGQRLAWARKTAGFRSAAQFARIAQVPEVTYRAHENGSRGLSEAAARAYAAHLPGIRWAWLLTGEGAPEEAGALQPAAAALAESARPFTGVRPSPMELPNRPELGRDLPVMGTAVGGNDGDFTLNGNSVDYVRRPPGLAGARNAFAVYVIGQSMVPRFDEGDLVFVHPGRPPVVGSDVLVELQDPDGSHGPCFIKRLVKRTASAIVLEQFNPPRRDISFPLAAVRSLYRILTLADLFGV